MSKGRKKAGEPSPEDRRKAELLEKFRSMIPELKRPSTNRVMLAPEPEWSQKTKSFLMGVPDDHRPWPQAGMAGRGRRCVRLRRSWRRGSSWTFSSGPPGASTTRRKLDMVLRIVIANAYSEPRRPHREFRRPQEQKDSESSPRIQARPTIEAWAPPVNGYPRTPSDISQRADPLKRDGAPGGLVTTVPPHSQDHPGSALPMSILAERNRNLWAICPITRPTCAKRSGTRPKLARPIGSRSPASRSRACAASCLTSTRTG